MKGIILAGGHGTRLYPVTKIMSKQLLPVYDKPMIYYPLSTLISCNISDILLIVTPEHSKMYEDLLGNGSQLGIKISYAIQEKPTGIAECFILGKNFINNHNVTVMLGDNIFYGYNMYNYYALAAKENDGCTIFSYRVKDPERYGVVATNSLGKVISIEEKPIKPKSSQAIIGFYIFTPDVIDFATSLTPSNRGELEITDVLNHYKDVGRLNHVKLKSEFSWLDTGTAESLLEASSFIKIVEERQSLKVGCIEEAAYGRNFLTRDNLKKLTETLPKSDYRMYLEKIYSND